MTSRQRLRQRERQQGTSTDGKRLQQTKRKKIPSGLLVQHMVVRHLEEKQLHTTSGTCGHHWEKHSSLWIKGLGQMAKSRQNHWQRKHATKMQPREGIGKTTQVLEMWVDRATKRPPWVGLRMSTHIPWSFYGTRHLEDVSAKKGLSTHL